MSDSVRYLEGKCAVLGPPCWRFEPRRLPLERRVVREVGTVVDRGQYDVTAVYEVPEETEVLGGEEEEEDGERGHLDLQLQENKWLGYSYMGITEWES